MPRKRKADPTRQAAPSANGGGKPPTQPVMVASGQAYGQRQAQVEAQQAVPLPALAQPQPGGWQQALTAAQQMVPPGQGFAAPTARPGEPITAGLAVGAGPGPEILPSYRPSKGDIFRQLHDATGDPQFGQLAVLADEMGL